MNTPLSSFLVIAGLLLIGTSPPSYSQPVDSCLTLIWSHDPDPNGTRRNPDMVKIDTCSNSVAKGARYAHQWFEVEFDFRAVKIPPAASNDTIIEVTWQAIDTAYPTIRSGFQQLEHLFGPYVLCKAYPAETDTSHVISRRFTVRFDSLVRIDSVVRTLEAIPHTFARYLNRAVVLLNAVPIAAANGEQQPPLIFPNPATDNVRLEVTATNYHQPHVSIYDNLGQLIGIADAVETSTGVEAMVDARELPNGTYYIRYGALTASFIIKR